MNTSDRASLSVTLKGARSVVHLGGLTQEYGPIASRSYDEFRAANVDATAVLARAAAAAGIRTFVFMSSVSAVSAAGSGPISETTSPAPTTFYGRSKLEAEKSVEEIGAAAGMRVVSLRPTMVFGPGMKGNALRLFDFAWRGVPIPVGSVRNSRSVIFVGNLVRAIRAALESEPARGAFLLADNPALSTADLSKKIATALGVRANVVSVPPAILRMAGEVGDLLSRAGPWPLTSREVSRLTTSLAVDSSLFSRLTGFAQPYTLEEGLLITARWYRGQKE